MFLKINNFLTGSEVARLTALSRELRFVDGRVSNPANQTKDNLQADHADPKYAESVQIVSAAFARSREFVDFAMPKRVAPPLLCRYEPGMKYGAHADAALIQLGQRPPAVRPFVHGLRRRSRRLRRRRAVDRGRQPGDPVQGRGGRGHRLSVDHAARGRSGAFRPAPGVDHVHRKPHRRPAPAHADLRAQRDRRARGPRR